MYEWYDHWSVSALDASYLLVNANVFTLISRYLSYRILHRSGYESGAKSTLYHLTLKWLIALNKSWCFVDAGSKV